MKTLLLLLFIIFCMAANATNYYLSNSGNDANSGTDPSTPWQTLNKFNSFKNLKPGDHLLFKRGDTFYGSITVSNSGSAGNPITYGAYGVGVNPVITGFTNVTSWINLGGNIWESTSAVSTLSYTNMVVVNGVNTPMGRFPNTGYLTFQSHSGKTSITSSSLTGRPNWTGAEVVVRSSNWTLDRMVIIAQSGSTLTYGTAASGSQPVHITNTPIDGFGFFMQNDLRTLDILNEWYYNPSSKKLDIFSTNIPVNVQIATISALVIVNNHSYITFNGLSFTGCNYGILSYSGTNTNISIINCSINFSGIDAISVGNCPNLTVSNNTILNSNNDGIGNVDSTSGMVISNNIIQNTGTIPGMGQNGYGTYSGIFSQSQRLIADSNKILNTGYEPIHTNHDSSLIQNNFIDSFCTVLQDGGGIYTSGAFKNRKIISNIVLNGIGTSQGTNSSSLFANGIYLDNGANNVEVSANTVSNCSNSGIFLHDAHENNLHNNTVFNSGSKQLGFQQDDADTVRNNIIKSNTFVSKLANELVFSYSNYLSFPIDSLGTLDSNYYARPIDDNLIIQTWSNISDISNYYTLDTWQTYTGFDMHSKKSSKIIIDVNELRFEYNASSSNKTIGLDTNYIDIAGGHYLGSVSLEPYSSIVLMKDSSNN